MFVRTGIIPNPAKAILLFKYIYGIEASFGKKISSILLAFARRINRRFMRFDRHMGYVLCCCDSSRTCTNDGDTLDSAIRIHC